MKSFYLDFPMYKEDGKVKQFIKDIEEYENEFEVETNDGKLTPLFEEPIGTIYIDSTGGENRTASILYNFLKNRKNYYNFVITGDCSSNTILLLLALNPKHLIINRQAVVITHLSNYNHPINEIAFSTEKDLHTADFFNFKQYLNIIIECYKLFLNKEEINVIKKGKDVYISSTRIVEIFKKLKSSKIFQEKAKNIFEITL